MSCADVAGQIDKLKHRVAKLEAQTAAQPRSAPAETGTAIQRLLAANDKIAELQREVNMLRTNLHQARADLDARTKERDEAQVAITNLTGDLVLKDARLNHLRKAIRDQRTALEQERDDARAGYSEMQAANEKLEKRLELSMSDFNEVAAANKRLLDALASIEEFWRTQVAARRNDVGAEVRQWAKYQAQFGDPGYVLQVHEAAKDLKLRLQRKGLMS